MVMETGEEQIIKTTCKGLAMCLGRDDRSMVLWEVEEGETGRYF